MLRKAIAPNDTFIERLCSRSVSLEALDLGELFVDQPPARKLVGGEAVQGQRFVELATIPRDQPALNLEPRLHRRRPAVVALFGGFKQRSGFTRGSHLVPEHRETEILRRRSDLIDQRPIQLLGILVARRIERDVATQARDFNRVRHDRAGIECCARRLQAMQRVMELRVRETWKGYLVPARGRRSEQHLRIPIVVVVAGQPCALGVKRHRFQRDQSVVRLLVDEANGVVDGGVERRRLPIISNLIGAALLLWRASRRPAAFPRSHARRRGVLRAFATRG